MKRYVRRPVCFLWREFLVQAQFEIRGVEGDLKKAAEQALTLKPNFAYTGDEVRNQLQQIFNLGYFELANPQAVDTRDGVKLVFEAGPISSCFESLDQTVYTSQFSVDDILYQKQSYGI